MIINVNQFSLAHLSLGFSLYLSTGSFATIFMLLNNYYPLDLCIRLYLQDVGKPT